MSLQGQYEEYVRRNKHFPASREQYKDYDIYLSEGGPYYPEDFPLDLRAEVKNDFPLGFYEAAYAVGIGDHIIFWQPLMFDRLHDPDLTESGRKHARLNATRQHAIEVIEGSTWLKDSISH